YWFTSAILACVSCAVAAQPPGNTLRTARNASFALGETTMGAMSNCRRRSESVPQVGRCGGQRRVDQWAEAKPSSPIEANSSAVMIMYRNPVVRRYKNPIDSLRTDLGAQPTRGAPNEAGRARCQRVRRLLRLPEAQWKASVEYHSGRRSNHWDIYDLVTFTAA